MPPKIKKIKIDFDDDGNLESIKIGGTTFSPGDGTKEPKPTAGVIAEETFVISYSNPTCVWRNGKKYCA